MKSDKRRLEQELRERWIWPQYEHWIWMQIEPRFRARICVTEASSRA